MTEETRKEMERVFNHDRCMEPPYKPQPVEDADMAFGPADVFALMPSYLEIPEEYKSIYNGWHQFFGHLFYSGESVSDLKIHAKKGIDGEMAWRHLIAMTKSWDSKHEHKTAAFAYLSDLWFRKVTYKGPSGKKITLT